MIEIKVTGNTPLEVLASVTAFGMRCMTVEEVGTAAVKILEAETSKTGDATAVTAPQENGGNQPEPDGDAPVEEPFTEPSPFPKPQGETEPQTTRGKRIPTPEETRKAGIDASRKYGQPAVVSILQALGVGKISELPESKRAAFIKAVEKLGEDNA